MLTLLGSSYAQYQYPGAGGAGSGVGAAGLGASPSSAASAGGVDNRILGLGGLLGGGGGEAVVDPSVGCSGTSWEES